jgi:hypothetical protein
MSKLGEQTVVQRRIDSDMNPPEAQIGRDDGAHRRKSRGVSVGSRVGISGGFLDSEGVTARAFSKHAHLGATLSNSRQSLDREPGAKVPFPSVAVGGTRLARLQT